MAEPLVSVVIPAYNREKAIIPAIQSVIAQGVDEIEIIVVDDCSTDGTIQSIETLVDGRIRLIKHEKNKGEAGARNTGIHTARGKYIAYLDSDDQWLPGKLKAQLNVMENDKTGLGGVYTLHKRLYQNGCVSIGGHGDIDFETLLIKGASISAGNTLMFRRDLLEQVGDYDEDAPLYVDWDWLLRFVRTSSLKLIPEPYAVYEKNPFFRKGEVLERAVEVFLGKFHADIDALSPKNRRICMARMYLDVARGYAENESRFKGLQFYWKALTLTPMMSAGSYLNMIDGLLGTKFVPFVDSKFRKV